MPDKSTYDTRDVQHFERWSQTYEDSWMQRRLFDRVHAAMLDLAESLPAPASVLDVGCGTGRLLRAAATRWPDAQRIGVDPAQGMVDVARHLTPDAIIYRGLSESLPLPDASVDLVFSTMSFHHWHDQATGVREIARILRSGGHFILADFALPRILGVFARHQGGRPAGARRQLLTAAGLRVEQQQNVVYPFILATVAAR